MKKTFKNLKVSLYCLRSKHRKKLRHLAIKESLIFKNAEDIASAIRKVIEIYKRSAQYISEIGKYLTDRNALKDFDFHPLNGSDDTIGKYL